MRSVRVQGGEVVDGCESIKKKFKGDTEVLVRQYCDIPDFLPISEMPASTASRLIFLFQ